MRNQFIAIMPNRSPVTILILCTCPYFIKKLEPTAYTSIEISVGLEFSHEAQSIPDCNWQHSDENDLVMDKLSYENAVFE